MNKNVSPDSADLRRLAEQRWNACKKTKTDQTMPHQDLSYLIKELEIAKIELEIRNEELTRALAEKNILLGRLRESRELLEEIINAIAAPVFYKNTQGVYLGCNAAFIKFLGLPREKIIGKTPFDIAPADLAQQYHEADLTLMKEGTYHVYETEVVGADGNRRQVMFHKAPFRGPDGSIKGIVGAMLDITERKQAEEALRASKILIEGIINSIPARVFWKDNNFVYLGCNEIFARDAGFTDPKDIIGKSDFQMGWRDQAELYRSDDRQVIESGSSKLLIEEPQTTPDGNTITLLTNKIPLRSSEGKIIGVIGTYMDITERKAAQEALRESENNYRFVVQNSNDIIWTFDLSTMTFTFYSNAVSLILGYPAETLRRFALDDIFPKKTKKDVIVAFSKTMAEDASSNRVLMEAQHLHQNGNLVWLEINAVLQKNSLGQPVSFSGVSRDITDRKRAEEEKDKLQIQLNESQKMESVGRLAGGVAHDFNNMLGVIIGHTEMAMDQTDSNQVIHEDLLEILKAAQHSADLTRQLLTFARRQIVSPVALDLNDTISGMLKMLRRLIGENIDLAWKPGHGLRPVKIDPAQVDQILANLLLNAKDAIAAVGAVTIVTDNVVIDETYCESHAGFIPGRFVMMAVSDSGAGMDKETLDHIFEPFYTTKEVGKGTGLGLATVYGIVKQNNGFINVYSEPGNGTSFKIYLPEAEKAVEPPKEDMAVKQLTGSETVLLVEDEAAILKLGKSVLERYGYTVLASPTPYEAITLAKSHHEHIHLLITDVVMPEMNGKRLKDELIFLHPEMKALFMSGYTANAIAHHGVLDKEVNFLQKPFSVRTLAEKVREVLDGK